MTSHLLDAGFARELEALRRRVTLGGRSGGAGDRRGARRGGAAEFEEHRDYDADDLRRIDWLAFARTGKPKVKVFREDEDVIVRLALDASASTSFGEPSKLDVAKRICAAIAYLALTGSERVEVHALGAAAAATAPARPLRGRAALADVLRRLDATRPGAGLDLAEALLRVASRRTRPGALVVLSDFLRPGTLDTVLPRLAAAGHDVLMLEILTREELEPTLEGDCTLVDAETGEEIALTADGPVIAAYEARLAAHRRDLDGLARRCRGRFVSACTDEALIDVIRRVATR